MDLSGRYRKRHRHAQVQKLVIGVVILGIVVVAGIALVRMPLLQMQTIAITGSADEKAVKQAIDQYFDNHNHWYWPARTMLSIDTHALEEELRTKTIGLTMVQKNYPQTLQVTFLKETPVFLWCPQASALTCYYLNRTTVIISEAPQFSENPLPVLKIATTTPIVLGVRLVGEPLWNVVLPLDQFLSTQNFALRTIEIKSSFATLTTEAGWDILVGEAVPPQQIVSDLQALLNQAVKDKTNRLAYIDLRFPNKAFYKFK